MGPSFGPAGGNFLNVGGKLGLRKSLVVVGGQNVVTIGGHIEFGIGLSLGGANHAKEFILAELLVAFNVQTRHAGLLPLLDDKLHGQVSVVALCNHRRVGSALRSLENRWPRRACESK